MNQTTTTANYRQTGWKNLSTGEIEIHYGSDAPADPTLFSLVWDNSVVETVVKTSNIAGVGVQGEKLPEANEAKA